MQLGKNRVYSVASVSRVVLSALRVKHLGLPFTTLFPEVKMASDGSRPELSSRKYSFQMLISWKRDLLDNTWLMCSCCVCIEVWPPGHAASSEGPLGFLSRKLFPNSALGCHLVLVTMQNYLFTSNKWLARGNSTAWLSLVPGPAACFPSISIPVQSENIALKLGFKRTFIVC